MRRFFMRKEYISDLTYSKLSITIILTLILCFLSVDSVPSISFAKAEVNETEYTVKPGDTLFSIARKFGIDADVLAETNNIVNKNRIYTGQKLIIVDDIDAVLKSQSNEYAGLAYYPESQISLDIKNADLRDVLDGLSISMGTNIMLVGDSFRITYSVSDVTPKKALELILQSYGLSYIYDNNIIIVGSKDILQNDFYSSIKLTRLNLKYVSAQQISLLIDQMGIQIHKIDLDQNPNAIWVKGLPQDIIKVSELIDMVDRQENLGTHSYKIEKHKLSYISSPKLSSLVEQLGLPVRTIVLENDPRVIWVQGSTESIKEFQELKTKLDVLDALEESLVFIFTLKNASSQDAVERLMSAGIEGVMALPYNYAQFSYDLIIICPPHLENHVKRTLDAIDKSVTKISVPVDGIVGEDSGTVLTILQRRLELLSTLTNIPRSSFNISDNVSRNTDEAYHILYVIETPDNINRIREMVDSIDNP